MAANDSQAPAPECLLDVRHLRKRFGSKTVLEDVSFTVKRGTICVVMGGSGSGNGLSCAISLAPIGRIVGKFTSTARRSRASMNAPCNRCDASLACSFRVARYSIR